MRPPGTINPEQGHEDKGVRLALASAADRCRLAVAGAAFAGGALFAGLVGVLFPWLFGLGLASAALAARVGFRSPRRPSAARVFTVLSVFFSGAAYLRSATPLFPLDNSPAPPAKTARLQGVVDDMPSRAATHRAYTRFPLKVEAVETARGWRKAKYRVRVSVVGALDLQYGDRVNVLCVLHPIPPPENPGAPDLRPAMFAKRIVASAWAPAPGCVRVLQTGQGSLFWRGVYGARSRIRDIIDDTMQPRGAALARRLLLGERDAVNWMDRHPFVETGTIHFLAVSGLHVGILAWFCWAALSAAGVGRRATALSIVALLAAFALLTGLRPPVVRAVIMASLFCFAFLLRRKTSWPSAVSAAAILILLANPAEILAPGFQLSFLAVAGILALTLPIMRGMVRGLFPTDPLEHADPGPVWPKGFARAFLSVAIVSFSAWAATLPLTVGQFRRIVFIAPLASVVMLPAVWVFLMTAFPGVLLVLLLPIPGKVLLRFAEAAADAMFYVSQTGRGLPGSSIAARPWPWWWTVAFYGLVLLLATREKLGLRLRRCVLACAVVLCGAVWVSALRPEGGRTQLAALRIRDGHATILRTAQGGVILYGAGDRTGFRAGRSVVDALLWMGARRIDLAVCPNGLASYGNALAEIAESIPIRQVVAARNATDYAGGRLALHKFHSMGVPVRLVDARHEVTGVPGAEVRVVYPPSNIGSFAPLGPRDALCALRIDTGDARLLLAPEIQSLARGVLVGGTGGREPEPLLVPLPAGNRGNGGSVFAWSGSGATVRTWPRATELPAPSNALDPSLYRPLPGIYNDDSGSEGSLLGGEP